MLRANQRDGHAALMKATAEAIIELARDRRHVGGTVGVMAVLHTWTQQLVYHPHVHCLVTGGGIFSDQCADRPPRQVLRTNQPLAVLVQAGGLARDAADLVYHHSLEEPSVIQLHSLGDGAEAVLRYLARYIFEMAITKVASSRDSMTTVFTIRTSIAHRALAHNDLAINSCAASYDACCRRAPQGPATLGSRITPGASCCARPSALALDRSEAQDQAGLLNSAATGRDSSAASPSSPTAAAVLKVGHLDSVAALPRTGTSTMTDE